MLLLYPHGRRQLLEDLVFCEGGAAILELAIALPLLFALLGGAFEIGRAFIIQQSMIEAVRGGARYLARVPDPTCHVTCSAGVVRSTELTRRQIAENSGLRRADVDVFPQWNELSETVSMQADLRLGVDLLRPFGLGPVIVLRAIHHERRVVAD